MRACVPNEETPWDERNRECLVKANEGRDAQPKGAEKPTGKETKHIAHITTHEVSTHMAGIGRLRTPEGEGPRP